MDQTTNLSIISAHTNTAGQRICMVYPSDPLYLKEIIVVPYVTPTSTPIGVLKPGTPDSPALRTIYVDPQDPVFSTAAPYTLAVTYDDQSFRLTAPLHILSGAVVQPVIQLFNFTAVASLSPEQAAIFVSQAVAAAAPLLNPPSAGAPVAPLDLASQARQDYLMAGRKSGKDKQPHAKS